MDLNQVEAQATRSLASASSRPTARTASPFGAMTLPGFSTLFDSLMERRGGDLRTSGRLRRHHSPLFHREGVFHLGHVLGRAAHVVHFRCAPDLTRTLPVMLWSRSLQKNCCPVVASESRCCTKGRVSSSTKVQSLSTLPVAGPLGDSFLEDWTSGCGLSKL